ncbi:retrovirus-related pol polyprotein from transposon TNT 1-94 [Tanacetum coccineum]
MLLSQVQEAGVVLDEEQQDFLADSLEETNDYKDLQLQVATNLKADHVDAYDSDCDDEGTSNAIFMENMSPVGSLNDDTVEPRYDSNIHSEVPHYDTYHDSDMLNSNIQELGYIENIVSNNESYDELKGNNDVISYTDYMLTIGNDEDNYVPPRVQKNDMMLPIIEQIKSQVEKCNMVNKESNSVNKSLTNELERYKDRVKTLGYAVKDGHSEQEAYLSRELYAAINDQQLYWSSIPSLPVTVSKPKVFPKKVPSISQVVRNLNKARDLLTKFDESSREELRTKLYSVTPFPKSNVIPKVVEKNDLSKSVNSHLTTKKIIEKCTKILAPELLVFVSASCPFTQSGNGKWDPSTSHKRNNKPYVDASRTKQTTETITQKHAKQNTRKTDNTMLPSSGRVSSTNASGSKPKSNTKNDRIPQPLSKSMKNKVEAHHRKFKPSGDKNNFVSDCKANIKNVALSKNSDTICLSCNECLFSANHDACVVQYLKKMQKHKVAKSAKLKFTTLEGLGHNLFFVGQFCDSDLEVTFRKHTYFVQNLEGVDLLSGSRGSNLYTISMADIIKSSPICLLSKTLKMKSWLWHRRLSHLNFDTISKLAKQGLVKGLPKLKYTKDHLCSAYQMGKTKNESHPNKSEPSINEKL